MAWVYGASRKLSGKPGLGFRKFDGAFLKHEIAGREHNLSIGFYRKTLHQLLTSYALKQGISITFDTKVTGFFETDNEAGLVIEGGDRLTADVVVAADGVGSKSRELLESNISAPISLGFVMYRCSYPAALALRNPIIAKDFAGKEKAAFLYMGPGAHIVVHKLRDDFCYMLTTKDEDSDATEN